MTKFLVPTLALVLLLGANATLPNTEAPKNLLSEYGFFTGRLADMQPAERVFPYEVNAPLFSDYAEKARFIALPAGQKLTYQTPLSVEFPVGAALIKNFYYYNDAAHPEKGRRILETRLLIRDEKGWKALEYLWNAEQTDAVLEVAGASFPFSWTDAGGTAHQIQYVAPNLNQCKGCHSYDGKFVPLGTTVRQLNREVQVGGETVNQLALWQKNEWAELPSDFDPATAPRLADYRQPTLNMPAIPGFGDPLTDKARAYLDANCGHCHNAHGPASTSGMFLDISETDPERLGVNKTPVAAGRGSGNRRFGIVPGKPQESILIYRMENGDPGVRMPELGRQLEHAEGVELIGNWIRHMHP